VNAEVASKAAKLKVETSINFRCDMVATLGADCLVTMDDEIWMMKY